MWLYLFFSRSNNGENLRFSFIKSIFFVLSPFSPSHSTFVQLRDEKRRFLHQTHSPLLSILSLRLVFFGITVNGIIVVRRLCASPFAFCYPKMLGLENFVFLLLFEFHLLFPFFRSAYSCTPLAQITKISPQNPLNHSSLFHVPQRGTYRVSRRETYRSAIGGISRHHSVTYRASCSEASPLTTCEALITRHSRS